MNDLKFAISPFPMGGFAGRCNDTDAADQIHAECTPADED